MRTSNAIRALAGLVSIGLIGAPSIDAQTSPAHVHMGHVAVSFPGTPDGFAGLLPTAVAEAEIAAQHAELAGEDPSNLDGMKRHMGHVINALDPSQVDSGPGLGFGVKAAATETARHIALAGSSEGASNNVKTHAKHVETAATNAARWADEAIALARRIQVATNAEAAAALLEQLVRTTSAIVSGTDADGDGRIGWQDGEGGLAQATQHMTLMMRGEGMGG